jgi:hypothetical protein
MIHFIPESAPEAVEAPGPYAAAVARLASIRQALASVELFGGGKPSDSMAEMKLAAAWPVASPARQRCYEIRSVRTASGAEAGLEAIAEREPHPAAIERLKRELGAGVAAIDQLFSL